MDAEINGNDEHRAVALTDHESIVT